MANRTMNVSGVASLILATMMCLAACGQAGNEPVLENSAPQNISLQIKLDEDSVASNPQVNLALFVFIADAKGAYVALAHGESLTCNAMKMENQQTGFILNASIPPGGQISCQYSSPHGSASFELPAIQPASILQPANNAVIKPGIATVRFQNSASAYPISVTVEDSSHQQVIVQQVASGQNMTTIDATPLHGAYTLMLNQQYDTLVAQRGSFAAINLSVTLHSSSQITIAP